jgi:hypothetical protein
VLEVKTKAKGKNYRERRDIKLLTEPLGISGKWEYRRKEDDNKGYGDAALSTNLNRVTHIITRAQRVRDI